MRVLADIVLAAVTTGFLVYYIVTGKPSLSIAWMAGTLVFWILFFIRDLLDEARRG